MTDLWRCAGCGIEGPDTLRRCDCPTNVVCRGREGAWKTDPPGRHYGQPVDQFRPEINENVDDRMEQG